MLCLQVRNEATDLCFDTMQHSEDSDYNIGVYACHKKIYSSQVNIKTTRLIVSPNKCKYLQLCLS